MPNRSKGGRRQRKTKHTVLIVTNGERTEMTYLSELKRRVRSREVSVRVEFLNGAPQSVLRKIDRSSASDYDEVWIIVDEDGIDRTSFVQECVRRCTKRQKWYAIVSRPCFEVWLVAHYERIRNYSGKDEAQAHFKGLIPKHTPSKLIPESFPYNAMSDACGRCHLSGQEIAPLNELPPAPGTAMPHLVRALQSWSNTDA